MAPDASRLSQCIALLANIIIRLPVQCWDHAGTSATDHIYSPSLKRLIMEV